MAWAISGLHDKKKFRVWWIVRVILVDGSRERCLELKFKNEPSDEEALAEAQRVLSVLDVPPAEEVREVILPIVKQVNGKKEVIYSLRGRQKADGLEILELIGDDTVRRQDLQGAKIINRGQNG